MALIGAGVLAIVIAGGARPCFVLLDFEHRSALLSIQRDPRCFFRRGLPSLLRARQDLNDSRELIQRHLGSNRRFAFGRHFHVLDNAVRRRHLIEIRRCLRVGGRTEEDEYEYKEGPQTADHWTPPG